MKRTRRRASGEGGLFKVQVRGQDRWLARIVIGGRQRSVYARTHADAIARLDELKRKVHAGHNLDADRTTLGAYLEGWLRDAVRPGSRSTTYELYAGLVRNHITPRLGSMRLASLTPAIIAQFYADLRKDHSARLVESVHARLSTALGLAVRDGLLLRNPCLGRAPKASPSRAMRCLDEREASTLLAAAERLDPGLHALVHLALSTGLREGELFGLWWENYDRKKRTLSVAYQLQELRGDDGVWRLERVEPKTARSRRVIDLSASDIEVLDAYRRQHPTAASRDFIFIDSHGGPLRARNFIRRTWRDLTKAARFEGLRFHDLRHTSLSLLLAGGVPLHTALARSGHSQVRTLIGTYAHSLPRDGTAAAGVMEKALARTRSRRRKI